MIRFISESEASAVVSPREAVEVMRSLFGAGFPHGSQIPRQVAELGDSSGITLFMPAIHPELKLIGSKISSVRPRNVGVPKINGLYLLIDYATGIPKAILDSNFITRVRTAAVSALVTQTILGGDTPHSLTIIGAGTQALAHAEAICSTMPISSLRIHSLTFKKAEKFLEAVRNSKWAPASISAHREIQEALAGASILCTCTSTASQAAIINWRNLPPSVVHINAIGGSIRSAIEIAPEIYRSAQIVVEDVRAATEDSGEIVEALKLGHITETGLITVPQLLAKTTSRTSPLSLYRSVGLSLEDLMLANHIFNASTAEGRKHATL